MLDFDVSFQVQRIPSKENKHLLRQIIKRKFLNLHWRWAQGMKYHYRCVSKYCIIIIARSDISSYLYTLCNVSSSIFGHSIQDSLSYIISTKPRPSYRNTRNRRFGLVKFSFSFLQAKYFTKKDL